MCEYKFSDTAYTKLIFHAAKYPHQAVNGLLLAEKNQTSSSIVQITDAIPLFHQCLHVTPMAEIALMQIDAYADSVGLVIAGYYAAPENFYENQIEKAPAAKMADKIQENYKNACFAVIDNKLVSLEHKRAALQVYGYSSDSNRWSKTKFSLIQSSQTLEGVSLLLKRGAMRDVIDFDNHLDNPENDWTNQFLNQSLKDLQKLY